MSQSSPYQEQERNQGPQDQFGTPGRPEDTKGQHEPLTGQQVMAVNKQYAEAFKKALADVELRKLALDQACRVAPGQPMEMAKAMHAFLTAAELKI
jgi:hypothetical protein